MRVEGVESVGHCCEHLYLPETTCGEQYGCRLLHPRITSSHYTFKSHYTIHESESDFNNSTVLLARERLGSSSRMRRSCESRKRRKLMP